MNNNFSIFVISISMSHRCGENGRYLGNCFIKYVSIVASSDDEMSNKNLYFSIFFEYELIQLVAEKAKFVLNSK